MRTDTERAKDLIRTIFEDMWNQGDFSALDRLPEEIEFTYLDRAMTTGRDDLPGLIESWRRGFPDLEFTIHDLVAEDGVVAVRLTYTGTHLGPWQGMEPTGNRIAVGEMMFFRFEGDRLVAMWEIDDVATRTRQLDTEE